MAAQKEWNVFSTALYIRLSREDGDKEESDSVKNQRKLLTEYISGRKEFRLYEIYIDDGYSGTNFNRPGFQRMTAEIEAGNINCVIVKDLSRFGRDYIDTGKYLERCFPEMGVRFISVADNIDSMKQAYDMLLPLRNIFNEQYARDISRKIQSTIHSKQRAGEFIGAFPSYGYKKSSADKNKLVIDEYAAEVVRRIFFLYIQGYGKRKIAAILNEAEILCPSEYKKARGENYKNRNRPESTVYWSYSTINSILHKEIYAGNMVQGTKRQRMHGKQKGVPKENWVIVKHTHEPIIEQDTWAKAQVLLGKRTRETDTGTEAGTAQSQHVLAGFVKCGDCGRAMVKTMWRRADGSKVYTFYCGTYKRNGRNYCTPHTLPMTVLEEILKNDLQTVIDGTRDLKKLIRSQDFSAPKEKKTADMELGKICAELERVRRRNQSLYEDYKEELISKREFLSYREDYLKKEALYCRQLDALKEQKKEAEQKDIFEAPWLKKLLEGKGIETLDREIVTEMVSEIRIYEDRRIKITYNFSNTPGHTFSPKYDAPEN